MITVQPSDYLSERSVCSENSLQCFDENAIRPDCTLCAQDTIVSALQCGHLTAEQALWLHQHQINWQINVEGHQPDTL